jgi:hypothetical protein
MQEEYLIRFYSSVTKTYRHTISRASNVAGAERLAKARLSSPSYKDCTLIWVKPLKQLVGG